MHPRHDDDETRHGNWLTTVAIALFFGLLVSAAIKYDLWLVPEDRSAAVLLPDGAAEQPLTTAQRH